MTDCPHGFEPRYRNRCALCRLSDKRMTERPALPVEPDAKQAAANDR